MKKRTVVLMAACCMLLGACSSNTPTKTVEKAFDAGFAGVYQPFHGENGGSQRKVGFPCPLRDRHVFCIINLLF